MLAKFLQWIMTKKTWPEYMKLRARYVAGFLVTMMVVVTALMGAKVAQQRKWYRDAGCNTGDAGLVVAGHYYAPFDIQRYTPVLN
jgi:NADH:ubiquinone oxidoreductase subunit 6 (subunit J)